MDKKNKEIKNANSKRLNTRNVKKSNSNQNQNDKIIIRRKKGVKDKVILNEDTKNKNVIALAGFICSVCGFITCGLSSIVGVVLSLIGLNKSKKSDGEGRQFAIIGLVVGVIIIVLTILILSFIFLYGSLKVNNLKNKVTKETSQNNNLYDIGDTIIHKDETGTYTLKITDVKEVEDVENNARGKIIKVTYEYYNKDIIDGVYISSFNFDALNKNNESVEVYYAEHIYPVYAYPNGTAKAEVLYNVGDNDSILLKFYNSPNDYKEYALFNLKW